MSGLIAAEFPDLRSINLEYAPVTEATDAVFFETYVKTSTVLRHPERRTYQIFANERLATERPNDEAIRAILVHELFHIRDYVGKSIWQLLELKRKVESQDYRQQYELPHRPKNAVARLGARLDRVSRMAVPNHQGSNENRRKEAYLYDT